MEEVLRAWGLDQGEMHRIHPSAWEVEGRYVLKEYLNPEELEQNVRVLEALRRLQIPAARVVRTISGKSAILKFQPVFLSGCRIFFICQQPQQKVAGVKNSDIALCQIEIKIPR